MTAMAIDQSEVLWNYAYALLYYTHAVREGKKILADAECLHSEVVCAALSYLGAHGFANLFIEKGYHHIRAKSNWPYIKRVMTNKAVNLMAEKIENEDIRSGLVSLLRLKTNPDGTESSFFEDSCQKLIGENNFYVFFDPSENFYERIKRDVLPALPLEDAKVLHYLSAIFFTYAEIDVRIFNRRNR